ncbi:hypothetical protein [Enterococcus gallinarum]|uniref:hypothetical protein n=1 Tax=Enterococcus gallinarum TaxID=1353 RepID=UPI002DB77D5E|nr:hypothetical protein [Enterococcus gallinarum]MEB5968598.1 hypothetical protein [Enterococcus gallinarum]
MSKVLKWLEDEADRLLEECDSNHDPYKSINNSFLEGFNYAVANVEALKQPQLNPNQQIVLEWLKKNYFDSYFKAVISNLFFFIRHDDIDGFPNETSHKMVEAYGQLSNKEFAKVLEVFSRWVQEQEEKQ